MNREAESSRATQVDSPEESRSGERGWILERAGVVSFNNDPKSDIVERRAISYLVIVVR